MPTSATGNRCAGLPRDAGVSLVEAMVALLIIGLMVSAVMLMAPPQDRETRALAERMAAHLTLASEESILTNRPVALLVTREGYGFARLEETGWRRIETGSPLTFRVWPEGVAYTLDGDASGQGDRVVRFDALGGATPARIVLTRGGAHWSVAVDAEGEAHVARVE
jgi:type II secretion system protein H